MNLNTTAICKSQPIIYTLDDWATVKMKNSPIVSTLLCTYFEFSHSIVHDFYGEDKFDSTYIHTPSVITAHI